MTRTEERIPVPVDVAIAVAAATVHGGLRLGGFTAVVVPCSVRR